MGLWVGALAAGAAVAAALLMNLGPSGGGGGSIGNQRSFRTGHHRRDSDRDGLSNWAEVHRYHTNPHRRDTDGDGLGDGAEVKRFHTDPRRRDTDGDGFSDGYEVHHLHSNPRDPNDPPRGSSEPGPSGPPTVAGSAGGAGPPDQELPLPACTEVASGLTALQSAVSSSAPGAVVCLAAGSYGTLALNASEAAPGVMVRAEVPGRSTLAGVTMQGSYLTVAGFDISGEVEVEPGSSEMSVEHNRISGGYFGVDAGPTTTTTVDDVAIVGNQFVGPFGEDAIRLNRYHDGDGDGVGALIEGNEITNVRENGNHSDCLQTVWVGDHLVFRKNYLHDNRCQGFFVKDQSSPVNGITVENNLFLRDHAPCAPEAPGCGQPSIFQVFGPYTAFTMTNNTIWDGEVQTSFQNGSSPDSVIANNVIGRLWTSTPIEGVYEDNTRCKREEAAGGSWPTPIGEVVDCNPPFANPAQDDYRLANGRGVDWAPATQHYGF